MARHEGYREDLAALEVRPRARRTEDAQSARHEEIGDAAIERQFRTDDREIDRFAFGEGRNRGRIARADVRDPGNIGDAGVARRANDLADGALGGELPCERMLAAATADHQHFHDAVSKFNRVSGLGSAT